MSTVATLTKEILAIRERVANLEANFIGFYEEFVDLHSDDTDNTFRDILEEIREIDRCL